MKLLALWDAFLPSSRTSFSSSVNGIPSFHFGQLLVPHYVADAIHFLSLSLSLPMHLGIGHTLSAEDMLARACPSSHSGLPLTIRKFRSQRKFFYDFHFQNWSSLAKAVIFASRTKERWDHRRAAPLPSSQSLPLLTWCFSTSAAVNLEFMCRNDGEEGAKKCRV